jgi:hypothetical protein
MRAAPLSYFLSLNGVELLLSADKRISSETRSTYKCGNKKYCIGGKMIANRLVVEKV